MKYTCERKAACQKKDPMSNEYALVLRVHWLRKVTEIIFLCYQVDVCDKLKLHQLSSENMADIYDVSHGKPVLHNTALRLTVNYADTQADTDADYQVTV